MKSIIDLRSTPDAHEYRTLSVTKSIFHKYFWYQLARNIDDWRYTDSMDLKKFGHNVNRAQFYRRLIPPLVIFENKCNKCGVQQGFIYIHTEEVEAQWVYPGCNLETLSWEIVTQQIVPTGRLEVRVK